MPERQLCDLSHFAMQTLVSGRMKAIARLPVVAGDSFEFDSQIMVRLQQLRRPLALDFKVDVFAFFCPYRFAYGEEWISHIEEGMRSTRTFPTFSVTDGFDALMAHRQTLPLHLWHDYANIWNCYFRDPSQAELSLTTPLTDSVTTINGLNTAHLKGWGTAQSHMDATDGNELVSVTSGNIKFSDIQRAQSRVKAENFRDFYSSRYVELMASLGGSPPSDYSDNVPELVWRDSLWLSGYDVNGTSGAQLGASVGKGVGMLNLRIPRRLFTEHGTLYVFAVMRLPPVFTNAVQYLDNFNRGFQPVVPMSDVNLPPVQLTMSDLFFGTGGGSAGRVPYYEWYRDHPNFVHRDFIHLDTGWQYFTSPNNAAGVIEHGNLDAAFQSPGMRHAILTCQHNISAWRPIPPASASINGDL